MPNTQVVPIPGMQVTWANLEDVPGGGTRRFLENCLINRFGDEPIAIKTVTEKPQGFIMTLESNGSVLRDGWMGEGEALDGWEGEIMDLHWTYLKPLES